MSRLPYRASTYSKSPVAFGEDFPCIATHGDMWRIFVDGTDLCDMVMGLGAVILGHRHPAVDEAIRRQLGAGTTLSLATKLEEQAAEWVLRHFPDGHVLQWGVNGSDAVEGAIRLARLVTGRERIVVAADSYHGFHDWSLTGTPRGEGIPESFYGQLLRIVELGQLNDIDGGKVAAVVIEPDEHADWLNDLGVWCTDWDALLIADEVMTWQRYPQYTACAHYNVSPDITCLGKSLGNGMPCSAIVGRAEILRRFAPPRPNAFFSATWAGHPLSMAAVIATAAALEATNGTQWLWDQATHLHAVLEELLWPHDFTVGPPPWNRVAHPRPIMPWVRREMAKHGTLIYAAHNLSLAHNAPAIERLLNCWKQTLQALVDSDTDPAADATAGSGIMRR